MNNSEKLLDLLLDKGVIKEKQRDEVLTMLADGDKNVSEVLLYKKLIKPEDLAKIVAEANNMTYVCLMDMAIDEDVLRIISADVSSNYGVICYEKTDKSIKVGIVDPDNFKAIEAIEFLAKGLGLHVEFALISMQSYKNAFKKYQTLSKELSSALKVKKEEEEEDEKDLDKLESSDLEEITKSAPVAKIVSVIIKHAVEGAASDIHIEPLRKESRVRYRIDGVLHTSLVLPRTIHDAIVARIKVMSNLKIDETRIPQDGRIKLVINGKKIDFRVSILPLVGCEKVVMRILDVTKGALTLEELGYQGIQLDVIMRGLRKTDGMFLVTGPTGSGKSTTLFSVMQILNKEEVNIVTLEDPVEYQMKGVNQSQVTPEIGYNFASGLRSFLRQDPDVIMVGEIRDEETAELATHAALTGHFVLSTLHTNDATGTVIRLVDMGVEKFLLGSTLNTIIAQRLARRICQNCKTEVELSEDYQVAIKDELEGVTNEYIKRVLPDYDPSKKFVFYKGNGCSRCGETGYKGRVCISSVMEINQELKEKIINSDSELTVDEVKETQEFVSVKQDGIIKVLQGLTTIEEVFRISQD